MQLLLFHFQFYVEFLAHGKADMFVFDDPFQVIFAVRPFSWGYSSNLDTEEN
jgi:hypothetical protein